MRTAAVGRLLRELGHPPVTPERSIPVDRADDVSIPRRSGDPRCRSGGRADQQQTAGSARWLKA